MRSFFFCSILTLFLAGCGMKMLAAPSTLTAELLSGGAHLKWKDNSDNETQFMIERKSGTGMFTTLTTVPFNTTQYHDAPLMAGTAYTYRVMAMSNDGMSDPSNEVPFTLP